MEVAIINLENTYTPSLPAHTLSQFGISLNPSFEIKNPTNGKASRITRSHPKTNNSLPTFTDYDSGTNESDFGSQELGDDLPQPSRKELPDRSESRAINAIPGCNCQYCNGSFTKEGPSTTW
jgi:hypothetical protein